MELKKNAKQIFQAGDMKVWKDSEDKDYKLVDNDLYFYDPRQKLETQLGNMGDNWVCIYEDFS